MSRKKNKFPVLENLEILDYAAEGKCFAKHEEKIVFVPFTAPGDIVDAKITKRKKNFLEAKAFYYHKRSEERIEPKCEHFSVCGGCKWQHISYPRQLEQKQEQIIQQFDKIGRTKAEKLLPIVGAENYFEYRNKVELSFSDQGWIEDVTDKSIEKEPALGFHVPGRFDKVLNINHCHLVSEQINAIIQFVSKNSKHIPHYKIRDHEGVLRNLIVRTSSKGGLMVILVTTELTDEVNVLMNSIKDTFSDITSLNYVINTKKNDTIFDLDVVNFSGESLLHDQIGNINYTIRPKSFFQTNSQQVYNLYQAAIQLADFKKEDLVYDLYTGTGSIALFIADQVKKVVGIEILPQAIEDAKQNAIDNEINNCTFLVGDMKKSFTQELIQQEGVPDILIVDPPRNGMDKEVIETILSIVPRQVIYISCNPATQARDLLLLEESYSLKVSQAVDMFPQTHHIENIVLLEKK